MSNKVSISPNERRDNAVRGISLTDAAAVVDCGECNLISDLVITSKPCSSILAVFCYSHAVSADRRISDDGVD